MEEMSLFILQKFYGLLNTRNSFDSWQCL